MQVSYEKNLKGFNLTLTGIEVRELSDKEDNFQLMLSERFLKEIKKRSVQLVPIMN